MVIKFHIIIKSNNGKSKKGKTMSKYQITINEINQEQDTHTASGIIVRNGEEVQFEAVTIWWDNTRRWKVKEEAGTAVSIEQSDFEKGERMAIAGWLKKVSKNPELVGKSSSQGTGGSRSGGGSSKVAELTKQNEELKSELAELKAMMMEFMKKES